MARRLSLRPAQRLRMRKDLQRVRHTGGRASNGYFLVYAASNGLDYSRLGIAAGRKLGSAPVRNRQKRLVREAFRVSQHDLPAGYDLLCVVLRIDRPGLADYRGWLARLIPEAVRRAEAGPPKPRRPV